MEEIVSLKELLSHHALVTYTALRTEVAVSPFIVDAKIAYRIEPRPTLDPKEEAAAAMRAAGSTLIAVLMPGKRFDASGTRHGQGGGWYDRFLALVPASWIRIGFCFEDQLSPAPLARQPWDQPMDYVCVLSRENGALSCMKTNARF